MKYTWGEIQVLSIQKMFLNNEEISADDLTTMKTNRKYMLYLDAMPAVANEGLLRLMSKGKPIIKQYTLTYDMPDDIFDYQSYETDFVYTEDLIIEGLYSKAYYFEINNNATIEIQKYTTDWVTIQTITHVATINGSFETYKGLIANADDDLIRIKFTFDDNIYSVRNVALYNVGFAYADDVYANTKKQKYDLSVLINDFYSIISVEYEESDIEGKYNTDYILEGDNTLIIDSKLKGNFIIKYKAYPTKIISTTPSTYKFTLPSEMIALLPLYIASELYKDDDISMATIWRNQFEASLSETKTIEEPLEYANNSGWL